MGWPGLLFSIGAETALCIAVSIVWVMKPRKSAAGIFATIEKEKEKREEQRLMPRD